MDTKRIILEELCRQAEAASLTDMPSFRVISGRGADELEVEIDGYLHIDQLAAALQEQHDARVTELLEANNREVERRRMIARLLEEAAGSLRQVIEVRQFGKKRTPGLPTDKAARAIGYDAAGRPFILRHCGGDEDASWAAFGWEEGPQAVTSPWRVFWGELVGETIIEHEIVEVAGEQISSPDRRPSACRFRLEDEGKPHPKSGCSVSGCGGVFGAACK